MSIQSVGALLLDWIVKCTLPGFSAVTCSCCMYDCLLLIVNLYGSVIANRFSFCRNVFFMRMDNPLHGVQVCVKECPSVDIWTPDQAAQFAKNGTRLCTYEMDPVKYHDLSLWNNNAGPCPKLPIFKR